MNIRHAIKKPLAFTLIVLVTLVTVFSMIRPALASESNVALGRNPASEKLLPQGLADPAELEAFLDELFAQQLEEHNIPGAAVSIVKDGKLFFAKGYGYADLLKSIPVDPEQTIFRIGSVGKLFTWVAVMQLVEQGKLDLEADINTYLDFRIPDTYPQPVTLKHLLAHTAGFEDLWFEVFGWEADDLMAEGEWLASHIPARVRPPGIATAYSNYGSNLAGYIVARVSGMPYEEYIQERILDPLGMVHSTAQSPAPPELSTHASLGYWYVDGDLQAVPDYPDYFGQPAMAPAGGHSSSATDMASFMIAHLQNGGYVESGNIERRILLERSMQQMHTTLYTPDPRFRGNAYGLFDFTDNGQQTLGHSGGTLGFSTLLLLLPDQNLGVFVAYNRDGSEALTTQHMGFQRAFFDHYYPLPALEPIQPPADFVEQAGRFVGSYRSTRSGYTTLEKIGGLMISIEIRSLGDGALLFTTPWGDWQFVEMEPLYFRQANGQLDIVFREDDQGRITHMFTSLVPQFAFEKLRWYETPGFNIKLLVVCVLVFLSVLPAAVISLIKSRAGSDRIPKSRGARAASWILIGLCLLNLFFVAGTFLMLNSLGFPRFGIPLIYRIVLGLGVASAVLTLGALVSAVLAWKNSFWGVGGRAYYTLVTAAAVTFIWFLNYWNLLGWRF